MSGATANWRGTARVPLLNTWQRPDWLQSCWGCWLHKSKKNNISCTVLNIAHTGLWFLTFSQVSIFLMLLEKLLNSSHTADDSATDLVLLSSLHMTTAAPCEVCFFLGGMSQDKKCDFHESGLMKCASSSHSKYMFRHSPKQQSTLQMKSKLGRYQQSAAVWNVSNTDVQQVFVSNTSWCMYLSLRYQCACHKSAGEYCMWNSRACVSLGILRDMLPPPL